METSIIEKIIQLKRQEAKNEWKTDRSHWVHCDFDCHVCNHIYRGMSGLPRLGQIVSGMYRSDDRSSYPAVDLYRNVWMAETEAHHRFPGHPAG